jgi:hypothetical protein
VTFIDLFELSERASRFEGLLKEENQRRNSSYGTNYQDLNYEIDLVECHNPIFTLGIFSGVGTQNEAARIEPA